MTEDAIEREIFIRAGIERVWSLVSKAGFFIGDELHFEADAAEGETVVIDAGRHGRFLVRVVRLAPPRYAAYRCAREAAGAEPTAVNTTLVEFTLREQGGGVLLRVRESGFAALGGSPAEQDTQRADNIAGWTTQLGRLRQVAEGSAG
jgi:uncharacterized protein YndB with AHSA1/START domain